MSELRQGLFGGPVNMAEVWRGYLEAPILEEQENRLRVRLGPVRRTIGRRSGSRRRLR